MLMLPKPDCFRIRNLVKWNGKQKTQRNDDEVETKAQHKNKTNKYKMSYKEQHIDCFYYYE